MERGSGKHTHNISFDKWSWWSENECLVTASHRVALFFQLFALFFSIFSISLSLSLLFSHRECQHYNFVRIASFSLTSYYVVRMSVAQKHLYIHWIRTLSFTLCSFTSFYVSTDWRFANVLLSLLVFAFTLPLPHLPLISLLITSFRTRTNLHTISFLPVPLIPFDVYSFEMKMWIIYLSHTWKVFLKPTPSLVPEQRSSYSALHTSP